MGSLDQKKVVINRGLGHFNSQERHGDILPINDKSLSLINAFVIGDW
jgi:hypothetical protein